MSLGTKMFNGIVWSAIERLSTQSATFLLGIVLARILSPSEYGILGILLVFTGIASVFIDSGFTAALVQNQKRTQKDISTVFFFNVGISIFFFLLIYLFAPFIADFYEEQSLKIYLRVIAISLIINSFFTVPATLLNIELNFKALAKVNLSSTIISGLVAIYLAYVGYGIWALIIQTLLKAILMTCIIWFSVQWKPALVFSWSSFKSMFSFGYNILLTSLLNKAVKDFSSLFIGKYISTNELGIYSRGIQFADFAFVTINGILARVLFSGFSKIQDDLVLLKKHIKQTQKLTAFVTAPLFIGLLVLSKPLILFLLTDKWIEAVPIMQIFCIARLITIPCGTNINVLYVVGKTNLVLRQQYLVVAIRVVFVFMALKFGIFYIALAELVSTCIHFFINAYFPGKIINYKALEQLKDLAPSFMAATFMGVAMFFSMMLTDNIGVQLILGAFVGVLSYYGIISFFKFEEIHFLKSKLQKLLQAKN